MKNSTMKSKFMSSASSNKNVQCIISDNTEIMIGEDTDKIIQELFDLPLCRYQTGPEQSIKGTNFMFDYVHWLRDKCHKTSTNGDRLYIDSPEWIKSKKVTINLKNNDNNVFMFYVITATLNHESIGKMPQRIARIRPFINQYDWEDINFLSEPKDWKKIWNKQQISHS